MDVLLLGPVEIRVGGESVPLGHPRQRAVLAVLASEANRVVPAQQLIERVWGDDPPASARNLLSGYVSRLRSALAGGRPSGSDSPQRTVTVGRRSGGYLLAAADEQVDLGRFRGLVTRSRGADDATAAALLDEALLLWRGPAFVDLPADWLAGLRQALAAEWLAATLDRIDLALRQGDHVGELGRLRALAAEHPLDERVLGQLMLALHRSGQPAAALAAYRVGRERSVAELGLDPGPRLRELAGQIRADDPALRVPVVPVVPAPAGGPPPAGVPRQLPAAVPGFTGRLAELSELDTMLAAGAAESAPVVISAIDGTAGVGKTALAVHIGHRLRARFPDGDLYANLRGYSAGSPSRPAEILTRFLRSLGLGDGDIPVDVEQAAATYRTLLTGRRMLILLDNAASPDQVRPLLPGSPGCLVLVTSRSRLSGLVARDGARRLTLDVLADTDGRDLLARIVGADRVAAEPGPAAELVRACAGLPLALRIAAANLVNHPGRRIADYLDEMRSGGRLTSLELAGDEDAAVRRAFDLSYRMLPAAARRLFRLLGLKPGPDVALPAAAALAGVDLPQGRRLLTLLAEAHLLEGPADGRYGCHDLLRLYAAERAEAEHPRADRVAALDRLYRWYLASADAAAAFYPISVRLRPPARAGDEHPPAARFADQPAALEWLETERPNLIAAVRQAAAGQYPVADPHPAAWYLADALRGFFRVRRYADDWRLVAAAGLRAARSAGDQEAEVAMLQSVGGAAFSLGRYQEAANSLQAAVTICGELGMPQRQAALLGGLGTVLTEVGQLDAAIDRLNLALELHRQAGNDRGEAIARSGLGLACWQAGRLELAARHHEEGRRLFAAAGSADGEAGELTNLGLVQQELGDYPAALDSLAGAQRLAAASGSRESESSILDVLALLHRDAGRLGPARDFAERSVELVSRLRDQRVLAESLTTAASIDQLLGRPAPAAERYLQALRAARESGYARGEAEALLGLAAVHSGSDPAGAAGWAEQALTVARRGGYRVVEGEILRMLSTLRLAAAPAVTAGAAPGPAAGDVAAVAAELATRALALATDTGHRLGEARALAALGAALAAAGDPAAAARRREQARQVYAELGIPVAES